jgi:hypothetical protein
MPFSIGVPEGMRSDFSSFLAKENIPLAVTTSDSGDAEVAVAEERLECEISVLYQKGWVKCSVARAAAEQLSLQYHEFGKVLNFLDIKIRDCELGCF